MVILAVLFHTVILISQRAAKRARKMRWICFIIILICLAALAIVLGVVFGTRNR